LPLRNRCACNESVIKVWLSLPAPAHRPWGPRPRATDPEDAHSPPGKTRDGEGAGTRLRPRGGSAAKSIRNGQHTQRAAPTGGALSGHRTHEARRAALRHAGAEAGMHHLGSQDTRRSLSCQRPKSHPVERQARRSHSLARPTRGPAGPATVERGGMGFQQDAVGRVTDRQRQDLGSGATIRART